MARHVADQPYHENATAKLAVSKQGCLALRKKVCMSGFRLLFKSLLIAVLVIFLVGCGGRLTGLPQTTSSPQATETQAVEAPTVPTPTVFSTVTSQPTPTMTNEAAGAAANLPAGWQIYTNPDDVTGIALYQNKVWASTLGGVAAWDLETGQGVIYTTYDGLEEIQANDIVFCKIPDERLIVSHDSGALSAYNPDLDKWDRLPITFQDGSTLHNVQALFCDPNSRRLFAGAEDGLGILDIQTSRWTRIDAHDGLETNVIHDISASGQTIWVAGGENGAFLIQGRSVFPFTSESGFPSGSVNDVSLGADGAVWLGYPTGLIQFKGRSWNSYGAQSASGIPFYSIDHVEYKPDGTVWIASADEGVCPFNPITVFCSSIYPGLRDYKITDLLVDDNGVAYAATGGGGVLVLQPDDVRQYAFQNNQLTSNQVMDMAEDENGRLWLATSRGINILDPAQPQDPWQVIAPRRDQLVSPDVRGLQFAPNGIWIYYDNQSHASFWDGERWKQFNEFQEISGQIHAVEIDYLGNVWFATDQRIDIWDGAYMRHYDSENGLDASKIWALLRDGNTMWAGTDRGLWQYANFEWELSLPDVAVYAITASPDGGLLLGTEQGLVKFKDGQGYIWIVTVGEKSYLSPEITDVAVDWQGNIWVGSEQDGLLYFNGHRWQQFTTTTGLPTNHIEKIYVDRLGTVWISAITETGGGGLVRYVP